MTSEHLIDIAHRTLLTVTSRPNIIMSHGKGMYIWDTRGNKYLDFIGGWAVNSLGHSPDSIAETLADQAKQLVNASPSFFNRPMIEFAERLVDAGCFDRIFFSSTGAEANEGAIKLARKYGQRFKNGAADIITTQNGFHGRTLATMAATGKPHWESLFEPKASGFQKAVFNRLDSVESLITEKTCAVMIEPIQGEGGINLGSSGFIRGLRKLCDQKNILLIFDEVQTGMGRTGTLFAYEHYNIEPDIMTLGKGIGGGFPLSALLAKERLNIFDPGDQGGTYTGQPLAMAVGLTVLEEILNKNILENCRQMGGLIQEELTRLSLEYEIKNIRGKGLLIAFDLMKTCGETFVQNCLQDGLLINSPRPGSIRLMPPLVVCPEDVAHLVRILKKNLLLGEHCKYDLSLGT